MVWLFWQNVAWNGIFAAEQNFQEKSIFVSVFSPENTRVHTLEDSQLIIGEPVYLDLRSPRSFATVRIGLEYRTDYDGKIKVSPILSEDAWLLALQPLEIAALEDGWMLGQTTLSLVQVQAQPDRSVRLLLSAPGISAEHPLEIRKVTAEFRGDPMTLSKIISRLWFWKN